MRVASALVGNKNRTARQIAALAVIGATALAFAGRPAEACPLLGCPATTTSTSVAAPATTVPSTTTTTVAALPPSRDDTADNLHLLGLMNADRVRNGLPQFTLRDDVSAIALPHSREMATQQAIWHNDDYFSSANRARLGAGVMAENVAMNHSVDGAELAFMNSEHHRANLLDPRLTVVGLGITIDNRNMFYVTQDFLQPRAAGAPTAPPAAAPAARPRPSGRAASNPRPVAARPATSPAVRPSPPVAVSSQVLAAMDGGGALDAGDPSDQSAADHPEVAVGPMHVLLDPTKAASDPTGPALVIIWVAGLLFLSSLPPMLRLAWQTARTVRRTSD